MWICDAKDPRMRVKTAAAIAVCAGLMVGAMSAHHSQSAYEATKTTTIVGTLKAVSWANPHSLFFVEARPSDSPGDPVQRWNVEGPAPRQLESAGWSRADAKIGEHITITGRPRRDGKPDLLLLSLITADGRTINFRPDAP
jgi:hypothetical protein